MSGNDIEKFKQYFEKFRKIFVEDKVNFLFQRALLSKGDYLVSQWSNKSFCSFDTSPRAKDDNLENKFFIIKEEIF